MNSAQSRWRLFSVCLGIVGLTILDLTKINVSLPAISDSSLEISSQELQILVGGYALAYGITLVPAGRWGDAKSQRGAFLLGLGLFTGASLVCAVAPNSAVLVAGRLLQGCAAGIQMPQVMGMIQHLFTVEERGRAFGLLGAVMSGGAAFGPVTAGLLIDLFDSPESWRMIFWMNVPLGIIGLVLSARMIPKVDTMKDSDMNFDVVGLILITVATVMLMIPFLTVNEGESNIWRWVMVMTSGIMAFLFTRWEIYYFNKNKLPLIDLRLFRFFRFTRGLLLVLCFYFAIPGIALITTLYLQDRFNLSPTAVGLLLLPYALLSGLTAVIGGRAVRRWGQAVVNVGLVVVLIGVVLGVVSQMIGVGHTSAWWALTAISVVGLGSGAVLTINQALTLADTPLASAGVAGSLSQLSQRIGYAIGITFISGIYFAAAASDNGRRGGVAFDDAYTGGMIAALSMIMVTLFIGLWPPPKRHQGDRQCRPKGL